MVWDETVIGWNRFWTKMSLDKTIFGWKCQTGFGRKCHWTKPFLDESVIGWTRFWMKVSWMKLSSVLDEMVLDESVIGWNRVWMKVFLDESVSGWVFFFAIWMKVYLTDALLAPPHLRWRSDALQAPQIPQGGADWNTCVHIPDGLRCVTWNTRVLAYWVGFFLTNLQGAENLNQVFLFFKLFGTLMQGNANAGRSAMCIHKDLLSDNAIFENV